MNTTTETLAPTPTAGQVATRLYRALVDGDVDAAVACLHPDVVLHVPGTHALAGTHRGLDEVLHFQLASQATTDDGETLEVLDVMEGTSGVGVLCRVTGTRGDRRLDNSTVHLLRVEDGRVTEIRFHNFDGVAVDAFWS